ncbi:hypothetical protein B0H19DRAFT_1192570 [Mycena capillaripes]|nr:hypothetical protein B0H19DRAFT_1192570 [Mycena capillaripes]
MESPFRQHFNTNYAPTDAEIDRIRVHLAPHEAELARLEALIRDLTAQRDRVKDHVDSHRALISHPRRLPQDLIEQIFLSCLPTHRNAVMSPAEAPLLLGRICSAWRSVAFSMPRLWASLHLSMDFVGHDAERNAVLLDWLNRSGQVPLTISVGYAIREYYDHDGRAICDLLTRFSARWHALHLLNIPMPHFLLLAGVTAPLLEDIRVTFGDDTWTPDEERRILSSDLFRGMNSRRITIAAPAMDFLVPNAPFSGDHITYLTLEGISGSSWTSPALSTETAYRLLKACTQLVSFTFPLYSALPVAYREPLLLRSLASLILRPQHSVQGPGTPRRPAGNAGSAPVPPRKQSPRSCPRRVHPRGSWAARCAFTPPLGPQLETRGFCRSIPLPNAPTFPISDETQPGLFLSYGRPVGPIQAKRNRAPRDAQSPVESLSRTDGAHRGKRVSAGRNMVELSADARGLRKQLATFRSPFLPVFYSRNTL